MARIEIASRLFVVLIAIVGALAVGQTLRDYRMSSLAPTEEPPSGALNGASSLAVSNRANCEVLARLSPVSAPPLAIADLANGTKRLTSAEGGYVIDVPSSWLVQAGPFTTPMFGQVHMTSYDPSSIDQRALSAPGMLPPEAGIAVDLQIWRNPTGEAPDRYVDNVVHYHPDGVTALPGSYVTVAGQQAYQAAIQDEHRFQPGTGPLVVTRQTRLVWVVPTLRPDRYLVVIAQPGESALRHAVEDALKSLRVTKPVVSQMPVTHQRSEIFDQWLNGKSGPIPGRRVEAKLMTYAEAEAAMRGGHDHGLLRIDRDPDELFWLVAVSGGPDLPLPRGGPLRLGSGPPATPTPTAWMLYDMAATNDRGEMTGMSLSSNGTWPPGFDAQPDLCH